MLLARTAAPADLVSIADIKAHLRIDHTYDDTTLTAIQAVVGDFLDGRNGYLRRALCSQTWQWSLPCFPPSGELHFPLPPLQSITSIQYYDTTETLQTFASSEYYTYTQAPAGYVKLKQLATWPATYDRDDAVLVTFVAGYGASSAVPISIRQAALILAGNMYANRGDMAPDDAMKAMDGTCRALLAPHRLQEFNLAHERYWNGYGHGA